MMTDESLMQLALQEVEVSINEGNAPFSVIVVNPEGDVVWKDHDRVKELMDPTAHGEVNAIRYLCKNLNVLTLSGYTFVTSSEPCPTCLTSMIKAQVSKNIYGAKTEITASLPLSAEYLASLSKKYSIQVIGNILGKEALAQRNKFFEK